MFLHMAASSSPPTLSGTYEVISGVETIWQKPDTAPRGLLFLAHGCQHGAIDFWPQSPKCTQCIGLPEEVRITRFALQAGWAVVAMSSADRTFSRCWSFEEDGPAVAGALKTLRAAQGLESVPIAAMGASSGGAFVLQLPQAVPGLQAVVSQIMAIPPQMLMAQESQPFPPALFIHMERDGRTSAMVDKCVAKLTKNGLKAAQILAPSLPIDDAFFSNRIVGLSGHASQRLRHALERASLLDGQGKLRDDPRRSDWREAVRAAPGAPTLSEQLPGVAPGHADSLQPDASALSEELNVAWAMHEITADFMPQTIAWIESKGASTTPQQTAAPEL